MRLTVALLFLVSLLCQPGCAKKASNGEAGESRRAMPFVRDEGEVAFKVCEVPVPAGAIERIAGLLRKREPALSTDHAMRRAMEEVLIPEAAVYDHFRARIPDLSRKVSGLVNRLKAGEEFGQLLKHVRVDQAFLDSKGSVGWFPPGTGASAPLPALLEVEVLALAPGAVSEPFFSQMGLSLARVGGERPSSQAGIMEREVFLLTLPYSEELERAFSSGAGATSDAQNAFLTLYKQLTKDAKVTQVAERWKSLIYPYRIG